ncbi:MAG: DUF5406 family protein [Rhodoblastus sp.]
MKDIIAHYSPNIRWGKQKVEIVFKAWDYYVTAYVEIGGNCLGHSVMETAIGSVFETLEDDEHGQPKIILKRPDGKTLECVDEESRGEEWLADMCVSMRIVDWTPPTVNEVREMNGAKQLPDGDRPWQPI